MLKLKDCKVIFSIVGLASVLLFASPTLTLLLHLPSGETFSELWILGPGHMAEDYPFNVSAGEVYNVSLGVANHMGCLKYYRVYVKFRNETEPLPNATAGTPSPLEPLYEYRVIIQDGKLWETPLTFSFFNVSVSENRLVVQAVNINNVTFLVNKSALWDSNDMGYYFQLFIELWIFNVESNVFEFHNRFIWLWFNMTG